MRFLLSILFSLLCLPIGAATYYVATDGDDSNAGTNSAAPWHTLSKVNDTVLGSNHTVYFRSGVWSNELLNPGKTVGLTHCIFAAYPDETPIFTGKFTNLASLFIEAGSYGLTFRGLTWSNNWMHANIQRAVGAVFDSCTFGWRGTNGLDYGSQSVAVYRSRNVTFTNCLFTHWGSSLSGEDSGSFLHIGAFNDYYSTNNWGHVVTDCRFEYGGHDCLQIYSSSNAVRRCVFFNPNWMPGPDGTLWGNRHIELITSWAQPNLIEDCDFGYTGLPVDSPETVASVETATRKLILRRNRFFDNTGVAVCFYQKGYLSTPSHNYIYHNSALISGNNTNGYSWYHAGVNWVHSEATNNRIVNNVFWKVGTNGSAGAFGALSATARDSSTFSGNLTNTTDPLWVSTNTSIAALTVPDLRLLSNSPAIGAAVWLTTITSESGSGGTFSVTDSGYFYDGWQIPGEVGDTIQLEGQTITAVITAVDYATHSITVSSSLTWTNGQGVSLPYSGSAPDVGAYEYAGEAPPASTGRARVGGVRVGSWRGPQP